MNVASRTRTQALAALGVGLTLLLAAGCANAAASTENVPELRTRLAAVDDAIANREFVRARTQIADLVEVTIAARDAGELAPSDAKPILAAASSLVSALPRPSPDNQPPPPETGDETGDEEEAEEKQEKLEEKQEELEEKREEQQEKKEEDDNGNGHSSENGPDDGHGN